MLPTINRLKAMQRNMQADNTITPWQKDMKAKKE